MASECSFDVVSKVDMGERNVFFLSIGIDPACCLGRQAEKGLDGGGGLRSCFELKNLPKQGE